LTVRDVAASERWYTTVLGLERLQADDAEGYVALRHRPSRMVVVLTRRGGDGVPRESMLDHLAFAVADGPTLEVWAARLADLGIAHEGVQLELGKPSLQLVDPDGIAIELVAPAAKR
jgi:catechol-2,3-dioxygenase